MQVLAASIREIFQAGELFTDRLQEIRMRIGQPLILLEDGEEKIPVDGNGREHVVTKEEIRETLEYISHYSLYAYEYEMKQGFLTIEGGHRVGISGKAIIENDHIKNMQFISSINLRISHEVLGCADQVLPYITANRQLCHTLIISYMGVAQNHLGMRTDILDCCPKAEGMIMLIRSMSPQVIAVDEIGTPEEVHAIEYAMHCGCKMLASVHGESMEEIRKRPVLDQMVRQRRFERYVILGNQPTTGSIQSIFDERGVDFYSRC